jgi:hypothetical protein
MKSDPRRYTPLGPFPCTWQQDSENAKHLRAEVGDNLSFSAEITCFRHHATFLKRDLGVAHPASRRVRPGRTDDLAILQRLHRDRERRRLMEPGSPDRSPPRAPGSGSRSQLQQELSSPHGGPSHCRKAAHPFNHCMSESINTTIITEADLTKENTEHWTPDYYVHVKSHTIAWTEWCGMTYGHEITETYNSSLFYHLHGSQLAITSYSYPKKQLSFKGQVYDLSKCSLMTKIDVERKGPSFFGTTDRGALRGEIFFHKNETNEAASVLSVVRLPFHPMFVVRITEKPSIYNWQEFLGFSQKLKAKIQECGITL